MPVKPAFIRFKFDDFAYRASRGMSREQTDCNGNEWRLSMFPIGTSRATEENYIEIRLESRNNKPLNSKVSVSIRDTNGTVLHLHDFTHQYSSGNGNSYTINQFLQLSTILDTSNGILKDGTFCINVSIQIKDSKENLYQPKSTHANKLLSLLESGVNSDISFTVGDTKFHTHSLILQTNAPFLAENSSVVIDDIKPQVFQLLLEHVYSGCYPSDDDMINSGKELINAANKYELVDLKMAVETVLVRECIIDEENVAEYILFADAKSCPLLKEYAISFFVAHAEEVLKSEHSKCLQDSAQVLWDIMLLMGSGSEYEKPMTVTELRTELDKLGLDVDGTKEILISRLEEAKNHVSD